MTLPRVWVLYGGSSHEREVSLKSGQAIFDALKSQNFDTKLFDVRPQQLLANQGGPDWSNPPDIVFLGLHGTFGEDGTIQGFLDSIGVPYVGSGCLASALCFHKALTKSRLSEFGVPVPKGIEGTPETLLGLDLSKKYFLKPSREGSTVGVERFDPKDIPENQRMSVIQEKLAKVLKFDSSAVVEEWIEGRELTIPVIQGIAYPIVEIRPKSHFYDYASKYTAGASEYLCPAPLDEKIANAIARDAEKAFRVLECRDYGRLDVMLRNDGKHFFLEMNTLPGMTGTSLVPKSAKANGVEFSIFIKNLVLESWQRQRKS